MTTTTLPQPDLETAIVWSGGYDSTALLLDEVYRGIQNGTRSVRTISFALQNNEVQAKHEKIARGRIAAALKSHHRVHLEMEMVEIATLPSSDGTLLVQAMLWFTHLATRPARAYQFGYVKHDDFWHYKSEFLALVEKINALRDKKFTVSFPFEWSLKTELLNRFTRSPFEMHVLSMVSTSEYNSNWWEEGDPKNVEIQNLWEQALKLYALTREDVKPRQLVENLAKNLASKSVERYDEPGPAKLSISGSDSVAIRDESESVLPAG